MKEALEFVLVVTTAIGATIAVTTYAEMRGCHWPLDAVNAVRDAASGAAQAQDKRRAVELLLHDEEWGKWSDKIVAGKCGTSREFVCRIRAEIQPVIGSHVERTGQDGKTRRLPKRKPAPVLPEAAQASGYGGAR